jgi:hypothetical protein
MAAFPPQGDDAGDSGLGVDAGEDEVEGDHDPGVSGDSHARYAGSGPRLGTLPRHQGLPQCSLVEPVLKPR